MAASVPVPMARPRSAWARAAASLTPSPAIATTRPAAWSSLMTAALPAGSTPAISSSMPTWLATARAARSLSPVSSTGRSPMPRSRAIASAEVGLTVSAMTSMPRRRPSQPANTAVCPAASASAARAARAGRTRCAHLSSSQEARPTATACPPTTAVTPRPWRLVNSSASGRPEPGPCAVGDRDGNRVPGGVLGGARQPQQFAHVLAGCGDSVGEAHLPGGDGTGLVQHDRVAVGVARPIAHGQAMISTATAAVNAAPGPCPAASHAARVAIAARAAMRVGRRSAAITPYGAARPVPLTSPAGSRRLRCTHRRIRACKSVTRGICSRTPAAADRTVR